MAQFVKYFLMDDKDLFILRSRYHCCLSFGDAMNQSIG